MPGTPRNKPTQSKSLSDLLNNKEDDDNVNTENTEDSTDNVDSSDDVNREESDKADRDVDEDYESTHDKDPMLSEAVVSTVPNRTPAQLASETAEETAARYNLKAEPTEADTKNPRVQVYADSEFKQIPSGTHLHPDVVIDMASRRGLTHGTDNAQVRREITHEYDFAPDAEFNDKFDKTLLDNDRDDRK
jgi:hypothetical protein